MIIILCKLEEYMRYLTGRAIGARMFESKKIAISYEKKMAIFKAIN
mgnify:CR=1 FL=1